MSAHHRNSLGRSASGHRTTATHIHHHQQPQQPQQPREPQQPQCLNESVMRRSTSSSTTSSRHNTLQRSVRFEEVVLSSSTTGASAASARPLQPAASVANRSLVASTASETDGLLDALPQPPATFSDNPPQHRHPQSSDDQRHQVLRIQQQQHQQRVDINNALPPNEPQMASEASNNRENSQQFVTFCPPNMEPKNVVNATRL